ncbi:MAG: cellobiose phosphorylase [Bacillota bacterium]
MKNVQYSFGNNEFIIRNYDKAKTFSSFLPGLAGVDGIPMWSFYVNRGQVMGSFGVRDKNGAIMEFFPANIMYRNIERQGFRTFIKKNGKVHEIFSSASTDQCERTLAIEKNIVRITEENSTLGLKVSVTYFTMPGENYAAMVRKTVIEELGGNDGTPGRDKTGENEIEILDGLPQILPSGIGNAEYQAISNLAKAWFDVNIIGDGIAYYKLRGTIADTTEVGEFNSGNFYLSFSSESRGLIPPVFDMDVIFGENTALTRPDGWDTSADQLHKKRQVPVNKVSGGFTGVRTAFPVNGRFVLCTVIGFASSPELIIGRKDDFTVEYINKKEVEARQLVDGLVEDVFTKTADPMFDKYIEQCYLDNFLRGGYPLVFRPDGASGRKDGSGGQGRRDGGDGSQVSCSIRDGNDGHDNVSGGRDGKYGQGSCGGGSRDSSGSRGSCTRNIVYHVFSRKHGDMEREYNFFSLEPACYSQGNGNFRDVNQNRRNDALIKPEVMDFNVKHLMSLIQADGYNPLQVKGCTFILDMDDKADILKLVRTQRDKVASVLDGKFTPGRLMTCIKENNAELEIGEEDFLGMVLASSRQEFEAEFGTGYWSDHWTYNLDLVEAFLEIYPDLEEELLFEDCTYRFFKSPVYVLPRSDKYVLANGKVRQYGALQRLDAGPGYQGLHNTDHGDNANEAGGHNSGGHGDTGNEGAGLGSAGRKTKEAEWLRTANGNGCIYETNLFAKLVSLAIIKFASLDPCGMGIEMEADRPGWNDAMNGLPGLFGSGLSETAELKRLVDFLVQSCARYDREIKLYTEASCLMRKIEELLDRNLAGEIGDFAYWDGVSDAKEEYRFNTRFGIDGNEERFGTKDLLRVFEKFRMKLEAGLEKALLLGDGIYPTYFAYEAAEYEIIEGKTNPVNGYQNVRVARFELKPLPLFLEAPARMLKTIKCQDKAKKLYNKVKASDIYDRKLKMYKTSVPLEGASPEIGRVVAFTPGWLEREAVFMHMEYKYLHAMLKAGLYDEFFDDIRTALVPFMDPVVYGRSTLENSSFIASSANPDESVHGRGFVARMTGTNAEMLTIWFMMMAGKNAFKFEDGELTLSLAPILPGRMFDTEGKACFKFLGKTMVTYINPLRKNTYGEDGVKPAKYTLTMPDGRTVEIEGASICAPYAEMVRSGKIGHIEVTLA